MLFWLVHLTFKEVYGSIHSILLQTSLELNHHLHRHLSRISFFLRRAKLFIVKRLSGIAASYERAKAIQHRFFYRLILKIGPSCRPLVIRCCWAYNLAQFNQSIPKRVCQAKTERLLPNVLNFSPMLLSPPSVTIGWVE